MLCNIILSLDPSMHCTGWAVYHYGKLKDYGNIKVPKKIKGHAAIVEMSRKVEEKFREYYVDFCVSETQEYHGSNERMKKLDLMNLHACCIASALAVQAASYAFYTPTQWNKGVPKKVTHIRVQKKHNIPPTKAANDYLDAIAIADFHLRKEYGIV